MSRLTGPMSRLAARAKGTNYEIDPDVPGSYLASVAAARVLMKARGIARFPNRPAPPFVGPGVRFKAGERLRFGHGVTFDAGSFVDALSSDGVTLGDGVTVGRGTRIECTGSLKLLGVGLTVGDNVGLGTDCFYGCAGGIEIGDDTIVGNMVSMHAENHLFADSHVPIRRQGVERAGISIGRNCWLGAKVTILDGARIGDGCVVAAGSVVIAGEYPADTVYVGAPARAIGPRSGSL